MKKVLCALMLGIFLAGCGNKVVESIQLPDAEKVTAVQMILLRRTSEDFGRAKLQKLMEEIEAAEIVLDDEEIRRGEGFEDYYTVALTYQDETTDAFYFFVHDDDWYFQTAAGDVYSGAEFIEEYITIQPKGDSNEGAVSTSKIIEVPQALLEYAEQTGEEDFNFYYALLVSQYRQDDFSETDADAMALEKLMREARMYEYGRQNGYSITEDNKEEKAFWYLVQELNHNVEQDIKQEFRDGIAYKVGDTECWSVEEYWNTYYNTIIYPATQEYIEQEFMPKYEDAKVFYESLMTGAEGAE